MGFLEHLQSRLVLGTHLDNPQSFHFDLAQIKQFFIYLKKSDLDQLETMIYDGFNIDTPHYHTQETPLLYAMKKGDDSLIFFLLEQGANCYDSDSDGKSIFYLSLHYKLEKLTHYLIQNNAFILQTHEMKQKSFVLFSQTTSLSTLDNYIKLTESTHELYPIEKSARKGLMAQVIRALHENNHLSFANNKGQSLLHLAIISNSLPLVSYFLNRGISIDCEDNYGNFPLLYATLFQSKIAIVKLLIQRGATLDQKNQSENSALSMAIRKRNFQAVKLLCEKGVSLNHRDGIHTPLSLLHDQLHLTQDTALKKEIRELLFYFHKHGADVNAIGDATGWTPLQLATNYFDSKFYLQHMQKLIQLGALVDYEDIVGRTALLIASGLGRVKSIKLLIDAGADVNRVDRHGWSPLMLATYNNHFGSVKILIEGEAQVNLTRTNQDLNALKIAVDQKHTVIESYLRQHGAFYPKE